MRPICPITHRGHVLALVIDDRALIPPDLVGADRRTVEAKCLYALQIHAGDRPGPYTDEAAEHYVRHALKRHAAVAVAVASPARAP